MQTLAVEPTELFSFYKECNEGNAGIVKNSCMQEETTESAAKNERDVSVLTEREAKFVGLVAVDVDSEG
jgi:hypothetical protein